ncbi:MAG: HupE/UreJ family protein [Chloroflexota bacterium]|nr:HupE/UreJ family protein [Chloroflexota bacterium]
MREIALDELWLSRSTNSAIALAGGVEGREHQPDDQRVEIITVITRAPNGVATCRVSAVPTTRALAETMVRTDAAARLALPSDRSFDDYARAVAAIAAPLPEGTVIYADQGYFDARFSYPIASAASTFTVETGLAPELGESVTLLVRYMPAEGATCAYELTSETGQVVLDPRWHQAAWIFVKSGFWHILGGIDHLLFLLCLVIPYRNPRGLLPVATAFTAGHSITLIAAAYGFVPTGDWFAPLIETLIAGSIVYMALENIIGGSVQRRWLIAGLFGLIHGFGFSSALREDFQFAGSHLLVSLLSFNFGVELGQIAFLLVAVWVLDVLFTTVVAARLGIIILSALIAHTALHWTVDRATALQFVDGPSPLLWLLLGLAVVAAIQLRAIVRRNRGAASGRWRGLIPPRHRLGSLLPGGSGRRTP